MPENPGVALIDDDEAILDSLQLFLRRRGFDVTGFTTATAFLEALDTGAQFECVVTDVRMPGMSGLDLQRVLSRRASAPPLIIITGHGDIDMAVSAIKAGAFDFLEKPIDDPRLAASIGEAVKHSRDHLEDEREMAELTSRYADLSERQRQVVELAIHGLSNKEIGSRLGISPRTVEHYRESAMERMQANRFAQLIQMIVRLKGYARK
jgi:RNA polymerase sigma factor (sigma-70 family)